MVLMETFENKDCKLRGLGGPWTSRLAPWKSEDSYSKALSPRFSRRFLAGCRLPRRGANLAVTQETSAISAAYVNLFL